MTDPESLNSENPEKRLFLYLNSVLTVSLKKFHNPKKQDSLRLKWARLSLQAIQTWAQLRSITELEKLRERVEKLEIK